MRLTLRLVSILLPALLSSAVLAGPDGKLYWTDALTDKIQRANKDGSGIEDLLEFPSPRRIEIDTVGQKMYWVSNYIYEGVRRIQVSGLNDSNVEAVYQTTNQVPALALNVSAGKLYWTEYDCPGNSKIMRADLDGANVEQIVTGQDRVLDIELDVASGLMLWTGGDDCSQDDPNFNGKIYRASLEGRGIQSFTEIDAARIALDTAQNLVYWNTASDCEPCSSYFRAGYNGSGQQTLFTDFFGGSIDLDIPDGKMYFGSGPNIWRANLDGTGITEVLDGLGAVTGIAVEPSRNGNPVPAMSPVALLATVLMLLASAVLVFRYRRRLV